MKIAALQLDIAWHDRETNYSKAREFALQARKRGADIFLLPEMFATGFSMDRAFTAESLEGKTPEMIRSLAVECDMAVAGGFVLERGESAFNVSLAVDRKGRDLALYSKIHQIGIMDEDRFYRPGREPVTFEFMDMQMACFICYDLRFPELFRAVADQCHLVMVIASWPAVRQAHWEILLKARAVENQCYVAGLNRTGEGGGYDFRGGSMIIDPLGELLDTGGDREGLIMADIQAERVEEIRDKMPFLKDRRPELLCQQAQGSSSAET